MSNFSNSQIHIAAELTTPYAAPLHFELQPIMRIQSQQIERYELLYRGNRDLPWARVDEAVLHFLRVCRPELPPLFVNLSNEALIAADTDCLARVAMANDVVFELSEAPSGHACRNIIATKANRLMSGGTRMALDDFGAGRDSLERYYALDNVSVIKLDAEFVLTCMNRRDAAATLQHFLVQWKQRSITSVAEGIETEEMFDFVQSMGVELAQGWYVDALTESVAMEAA